MTDTIKRILEFNASIERVWRAITDQDELGAWFPNAGANFKPTPGYVGWFAWDLDDCVGRYAVSR